MEDTQDCTEMFFRMDKARLRQGILDCDATSCDCVDDTQEVRRWGDCGINLSLLNEGLQRRIAVNAAHLPHDWRFSWYS